MISGAPHLVLSRAEPPNETVARECEKSFSVIHNERNTGFSSNWIRSALSAVPPQMKEPMDRYAVVFEFTVLFDAELDPNDFVQCLRKLFAGGWLIPTLLGEGDLSFLPQLRECVTKVSGTAREDPNLRKTCGVALSYVFSQLSICFKEFDTANPSFPVLKDFAGAGIRILCDSFLQIPETHQYFACFLLNTLWLLNHENGIAQANEVMLQSCCAALFQILGNFRSIGYALNDLASFLSRGLVSTVGLRTKNQFLFIIVLLVRYYPYLGSVVFVRETFDRIVEFVAGVIGSENFGKTTEAVEESPFQRSSEPIGIDDVLSAETFPEPIPILDAESRTYTRCECRAPEPLAFLVQVEDVFQLLKAVIAFCNLNSKVEGALPGAVMLMSGLISKCGANPSVGYVAFLLMWANGVVGSGGVSVVDGLVRIRFFDHIFMYVFEKCRQEELLSFASDFFLFLLSRYSQNAMFIGSLLRWHGKEILELKNDKKLEDLVYKCVQLCPDVLHEYFSRLFYDRDLAQQISELQRCHILAVKHGEDCESIAALRKSLFRYVDIMLSNDHYKRFLFRSVPFMSTLIRLIYEKDVRDFAFHHICDALKTIEPEERSLFASFQFFQSILRDSITQEKYREMAAKLFTVVTEAFPLNVQAITSAFLHTNAFEAIVEYVGFAKTESALDLLLGIAQECSKVQTLVSDYLGEVDIFGKILPLVQPFFKEGVDEELLGKLWKIVFDGEFGTDAVHPIKNGAPLTLIFYLLKPFKDEFVSFLTYLQDCCNRDNNNCLVINQCDFPGVLIESFQDYRMMTEPDPVFDLLLDLWAVIAANSTKSKDLVGLFHNFSTLTGNFRPHFTLDILKSLMMVFQSPTDAPSSLYHLDGQGTMLQLPKVANPNPCQEFTLYIDIEFLDKTKRSGILFSISSLTSLFFVSMKDQQLSFNMEFERKKCSGSFNYIFPPESWTHIVLAYSKSKLSLYVHGKLQASVKVIDFGFVGSFDTGFVAKNIACNIGTFGLIKYRLSDYIIKLLASFPRNCVSSFAPGEAHDYRYDFFDLFSGDVFFNSVYIYSAAVGVKGMSMNLANVPATSQMLEIFGTVFGFSPKPKDIMGSIGGASTFLPLFAQLDQPMLPKPGEEISYALDQDFLPYLIQVLIAYLRGSVKNQEEFAMANGFMIIGHLLSRAKLQNITLQVIELLKRLYKELLISSLVGQMIEYIFLDMRLWIYLPVELQLNVYSALIELYRGATTQGKMWFVNALPFTKVLQVMRVFLWTKLSDERICLLSKPKMDKVTKEVAAQRPSNIRPIRDKFWLLAHEVYRGSFTPQSAVLLCSLSFDQSDLDLSIDTQTFMIQLIRRRDMKFIQALQTQGFTFESFFPLLISESDLVRAQCIHLFTLLQYIGGSQSVSLMTPFTQDEWVAGMMSTINTKNVSMIFADVVFGYMFGLYNVAEDVLLPRIRISQLPSITSGFRLTFGALLPFAMMTIADFPDDLCSKYLMAIDRTIALIVTTFLQVRNWDHPFIMFLMNRLPSEDCVKDNSATIALHTVTCLYGYAAQNGNDAITRLPLFVNLLSSRSGKDYSHILRMLFNYFIDIYIMNPRQPRIPMQIMYRIVVMIFEYMFYLNDASLYYVPGFDSDAQIGKKEKVTFQELHKIKWMGSTPQIDFVYAMRTSADGVWYDVEIAQRFCAIFDRGRYPDLLKMRTEQGLEPMFMLAFTAGIGVQHLLHFEQFVSWGRFTLAKLKDRGFADEQYNTILALCGGAVKTYFATPRSHPSHAFLFECIATFAPVLKSKLKARFTVPGHESALDDLYLWNQHNILHQLLKEYYKLELGMGKMIDAFKQTTLEQLGETAKRTVKLASHFDRLNATDSSFRLTVKEQQAHLLLHQFAASVRSKQRAGLKLYRKLWRSLSSEDGPWSPHGVQETPPWRLDPTILNFGRSRLITNYDFDDHKEASLLRDNGNPDEAEKLYADHLKAARMSKFQGDQSVIALDDDTREDEDDKEGDDAVIEENVRMKLDANLVTMKAVHSGVLLLTKGCLIFQATGKSKYRQIDLASITCIFLRHYLLLDTSIEIFTKERRSYFLDFVEGQRERLLNELGRMKLPNCEFLQRNHEQIKPFIEKAQKRWCAGELSNFEYLMKLNQFSGRTYNDLGQYPVFPWVIADYTSETLDFDDPKTFRNLAVPIGALDNDRLNMMLARAEEQRGTENDYLYASFYSSQAVVIGYLIRMEPFTSLHIELHSGKFDLASRLFSSIPKAWDSVQKTAMDFRELIPEFFYNPEFLVNSNNFDLGKGVGDVELPPWASSPRDFIAKNRAALESRFVTAMLPRWIDMIFGITSRGPESRPINNVFSPCFFSCSITDEVRKDTEKLKFMREYAACFGQAPEQIFDEPHKSKRVEIPNISDFSHTHTVLADVTLPILSLEVKAKSIVFVNSYFQAYTYQVRSHQLQKDPRQLLMTGLITNEMIPRMTYLIESKGKYFLSATPWDTAFVISSSAGMPLNIKRIHTKKMTAVAIETHYYATASLDCTMMLWTMNPERPQTPFAIISKFNSAVVCLAIKESCDMCIGCSKSGEIVSVSLCTGTFIRKIRVNYGEPSHIALFDTGTVCIAFSSENRSTILVLDINLNVLQTEILGNCVAAWAPITWPNGEQFLFVSTKQRRLAIYALPAMTEVWQEERFPFAITKAGYLHEPRSIIVTTLCGKIVQIPFSSV